MMHKTYVRIMHPYRLDESGKRKCIEGFKIWIPEYLQLELFHKIYEQFHEPDESKLQFGRRFCIRWDTRLILIPGIKIDTDLIKTLPNSYTEDIDDLGSKAT